MQQRPAEVFLSFPKLLYFLFSSHSLVRHHSSPFLSSVLLSFFHIFHFSFFIIVMAQFALLFQRASIDVTRGGRGGGEEVEIERVGDVMQ